MSRNLSDSKLERDLYNRLAKLEQQMRERGTTQVQGDDTIQIGYTADNVFPISVAPSSGADGLIGTFLCTLQYDDSLPGSVVFGDLDIAVNYGTDVFSPSTTLSAYYGGLRVEEINDLYLKELFSENLGYHPLVKMIRLRTFGSDTPTNFFIHTRWRYLGVGKTLIPATSSTIIIPDGPGP
jgi:hypothetical protein